MVKTRSEHWVTEPKISFGRVMAYGVSSWDMPDGHRLRREMTRRSAFNTIKEMERWARKYGLNVDKEKQAWLRLANSESPTRPEMGSSAALPGPAPSADAG
jgi:hypothetical protein